MRKKILFSFILLTSVPVLVHAQDTRPAELADADDQLNTVYQKILAKLKPADKEKLKKAQRAWIVFRDLDCGWAYTGVPLNCKIERTKQRASELDETEFYDARGNYEALYSLDESKPKPR